MPENPLPLANEVYAIIHAALTVYNTLGSGFLEAVYQEALERELTQNNIPFTSQQELTIYYRGHPLTKKYRIDLLCYNTIIIELKTTKHLTSTEEAQLINYLKATGHQIGLLINFGNPAKLQWKRLIYTNTTYHKNTNLQNIHYRETPM